MGYEKKKEANECPIQAIISRREKRQKYEDDRCAKTPRLVDPALALHDSHVPYEPPLATLLQKDLKETSSRQQIYIYI